MIVIQPEVRIIDKVDGDAILSKLDMFARICYQSTNTSNDPKSALIKSIIKNGHESVLEHVSLSFVCITDIGVLAELTRHRHASFSVESTRYVKYNKNAFEDGIGRMEFIEPIEFHKDETCPEYKAWYDACEYTEKSYNKMMTITNKADISRDVLNKANKTMIGFTANMRELRLIFKLRCGKRAHAHIKQIFIPLLLILREKIPVIFDDIEYDEKFTNEYLGWYFDEMHNIIYTHPKSLDVDVCQKW